MQERRHNFIESLNLPFFRQLAKALAKQFGDNCEVVLHYLTSTDIEHSVVLVENGHVTHRAVGDGPSHVVLEAMKAMELGVLLQQITWHT